MTPKRILTGILLALVVAGLAFIAARQVRATRIEPATATSASDVPAEGLVVYYFHGKFRCVTCENFENYSRKAVETYFADALKAGRLQWRVVNFDQEPNKHFVADYKLVSQTLVLASFRDGKQVRWRSLPKIWDLVGSESDFLKYVRDQVAKELQNK